MRKYDRESNTRIWEGKTAIIVRAVMVIFSLYCIYSTLFSVAALEKRLTAFLGLVVIMGYLTYPASKHHVRHNFIPWYDFVLMFVGAACFFYYCFSYDSLISVLTSASKMTDVQVAIGVVGILVLMGCAAAASAYPSSAWRACCSSTRSPPASASRDCCTPFSTPPAASCPPLCRSARSTLSCSSSSARFLSAPASPRSSSTLPTPSSAASPAVRQRSRSSPRRCAAWCPAPPWATPSPPAPSRSR